jgi:hypothetical protein
MPSAIINFVSTAEFEVMRASTDRRNTVWAAALAAHVRHPERNAREDVRRAILALIASENVMLVHSDWSGGQPASIPYELAEAALDEESQWHPRRLPWARRLRLVATKEGSERFWAGEFGVPEPIALRLPSVADAYQLQALTCAEATGMLVGVMGFLAGSTVGFFAATRSSPLTPDAWTIGPIFAWITGGAIGLAASIWVWNLRYPSPDLESLPPSVIPDQFNQGPDLSVTDPFGDPRY